MDFSKFPPLLRSKNNHSFLALCLSMAAVGIAAELIYATSGRFSAAGNGVLQFIPAGIMLYGLLEHFFPDQCCRYRGLTPVLLLVYGFAMLGIDKAPFSVSVSRIFGVVIGLFICAALVSFLESGKVDHLGIKVGISASLYSVAVYPFSIGRQLLPKLFTQIPTHTVGFLILIVLLAFAFYFWPKSSEGKRTYKQSKAKILTSRNLIILLIGLALLVLLGQVMNFGTIERQSGMAGVHLLYLITILLRIPFGALIGYWVDERLNIIGLVVPIALMAIGCLVALFINGASAGDAMAYLLFNLGQKGCMLLICILCMTVALHHAHKEFIAGVGLLVYFISEGFFNLHMLHLIHIGFDDLVEFRLTLFIIAFALIVCLFLIYLSSQIQSNQPDVIEAPSELPQEVLQKLLVAPGGHFTTREKEVLFLSDKRKSTKEIAEEMHILEHSVNNLLFDIYSKTGTNGREQLLKKIHNAKS